MQIEQNICGLFNSRQTVAQYSDCEWQEVDFVTELYGYSDFKWFFGQAKKSIQWRTIYSPTSIHIFLMKLITAMLLLYFQRMMKLSDFFSHLRGEKKKVLAHLIRLLAITNYLVNGWSIEITWNIDVGIFLLLLLLCL